MEIGNDSGERIARLEGELASLRERERELASFIENASLGLNRITGAGVITWANQAELDLLGYTPDEYVGHNIAEFHVEVSSAEEIRRRIAAGERVWNLECRLRGKDDGVRHVLISSSVPWKDAGAVHARCITRDVTDRKRYEERLLTQGAVGRLLSEASSMAEAAPALLETICRHLNWRAGILWTLQGGVLRCATIFDPAAGVGDAFAAACREVSFAKGVRLPGSIWESRSPHWLTDLPREAISTRLRLAAERGFRSSFGFPIVLGDSVLGVMEFFSDEVRSPDDDLMSMSAALGYQAGEFIERTRTQSLLAESEESYRVLAETASDGIITMDAQSVIIFANHAAARMFGYSVEELVGSHLTSLMPEHSRGTHKAVVDRYLHSGDKAFSWQVVPLLGQHRHGHEIPLEVSFGEYRQGDKHFFVGVIRDVTERKRMDEKMRQTAKLESLGVLAGGIAHDFNNLLTGILGNISLSAELLEDSHPAKETLRDAMDASERAAHLTSQMLAYSGKGRFIVEPVDISALIRQIGTFVKSSIPRHVTVRFDLDSSLPRVEADLTQLQQLLMNLLINAAEAIPPERQGVVLVVTRAREVDAGYVAEMGVGDIAPGSYVSVSVHDNGVGMDAETMGKIFDPFFTTKFTGRGLGLAAALGIVRGHKGALKVFSAPGQGTTFHVLLPASASAAAEPTKAAAAAPSVPGTGEVLVIDDEPIVSKTVTSALERLGYSVSTAENGRAGVERFRESHQRLAVVILDMTMPIMGGEEAYRRMHAIDPNVPIVLTSGYSEEEAIRRFDGKRIAGFIQKPYTAGALAEKIRIVLEQRERFAGQ